MSYQHQFKARPYNPDGFGVGGEQGVFRPQHSDKTLTQPAPFRLSTDGRASKRAPRYSVFHVFTILHLVIDGTTQKHTRATVGTPEKIGGG